MSKVLAAETMEKTSKGKIIELGQTHAGNKVWGVQPHGLCIQEADNAVVNWPAAPEMATP